MRAELRPRRLAFAAALACACGENEPHTSSTSVDATSEATGSESSTSDTSSSAETSGSIDAGGTTTTDGTDGFKYDVAAPDVMRSCGCGMGDEHSYIWVANAEQGTVSKIDTRTLEEEGRYITRPDQMGNPSRTSVALSGRAVAVANRAGGVVKIWSRPELCTDTNGTPGIQTSSGADDLLAWGEDECVAWYTAFPDYTTQRPVAWARGNLDEVTCTYSDETLWTAGSSGQGGVNVHRLDGETGTVDATILVAEVSGAGTGAYGGAADKDGNFWFARLEAPTRLVRVDALTLDYELHDLPGGVRPYGITVDAKGRVWVTDFTIDVPANAVGAARFDRETLEWQTVVSGSPFSSEGGIQQDAEGRMWLALFNYGNSLVHGITWIDPETMVAHEPPVLIDGGVIFKGISIDIDGYVWAVDQTTAYKIDPSDLSYESYSGLTGPYTYSDMTGWALQNAACTPEG